MTAVGLALLSATPGARADLFDEYVATGTFELPAGTDVLDVTSDGRIIVLVDAGVYVETGVGSREFSWRGTLPDSGDLQYPAFVRVAPDGTRFAVGDNAFPGRVGVFDIETLSGVWFAASHFDAEWYDDTHIAISGADSNAVTLLNTASADPAEPINPVVVDNTGSPAGIAFDAVGNLYTGNGFGNGPVYTGELRVFDSASWSAALDGKVPLDFISDGTLVVDILSAASLGFDRAGNLHVGGGDFVGGSDVDYAALVRASAVNDARIGLGPVDPDDPQEVRRIDPDIDNDFDFFSVAYNAATAEFYILNFGDTTVYTYGLSAAGGDPWADEVAGAHPSLDASGLYNDPRSVLQMPATTFYDPFASAQFFVSLVAAPFNLDAPDGDKLVTTINAGQYIKIRFDEPVADHPRNPYGIDFIVFGNSFLMGKPFDPPTPTTNMETHYLTSGVFAEFVTVAVSPTGVGDPETRPDQWYTYDTGPFADSLYPTNAYAWDRRVHDWGDPLDFTLPVDPSLQIADFAGISAADAIDLYGCSGGGTGFDLAESGFESISYLYLTSAGGEVDAVSDVFPSLGDFDGDSDVDMGDVAHFQNCFHLEREASLPCACRSADFTGGRDVGLVDFARMRSYLTGPLW